jgi:phosphate transport system substrate-binding protein
MTSAFRAILAASALSFLAGTSHAQAIEPDKAIPAYSKTSGVSGNLNSVGSDTLNDLMGYWAEGFQKQYPNVRIQIEGKGSSTAPPALIAGTAQLGPMSREMKPSEADEFEKKYGYKPTQIRVAIDALAVYVNKDNPISKLTLPQVDAVFSKNRRCGAQSDVTSWGQLGLGGDWTSRPISIYGRNSASGTYGYFKEHALCNGDYKDSVKEQPGSASVVQGVTEDINAIGYSGIGYKTSGVKALDLAPKENAPFGRADAADVYGGKYPLSRFLFIYVNRAPNKPLDPLTQEFLRFVLSQEGQQLVVKAGYLPVAHDITQQERVKLD